MYYLLNRSRQHVIMYLEHVQCIIKNTHENVWKKLLCTIRAFLGHCVLPIVSQNTKYVQNSYLMKKVLNQALLNRLLAY